MKLERVHNLFKLYSILESYITFEIELDKLEILDKVYTTSRYPGEIGLLPFNKPNVEEVEEMFEFSKYIYEMTIEMLD